MRKTILSLLIVLNAGFCYAGSAQYEDWRSTATNLAQTNMLISLGCVYVKEIVVSSGSSNDSSLTLWDSSSTHYGATRSTFPAVYNLKVTGMVYPVNKIFKYGLGIEKTGNAYFDIKWNFPYSIPGGKEGTGK